MMKKRIASIFTYLSPVCLLFLLSAQPAYGQASDQIHRNGYSNLTYEIQNGEVTITGYVNAPSGALYIPETIEGCPVRTIADKAFGGCEGITEIHMPSVHVVGNSAFFGCSSAEVAEMPNVQYVKFSAFSGCENLKSFVIAEDNSKYSAEGGILYNRNKATLIAYPSASGQVEIAAETSAIAAYSFEGCTGIKGVSMPSVTSVGGCAFKDCKELAYAYMPYVWDIGYSAFRGCTALKTVDMPNVKTVAGNSFSESAWYKNLTTEFAVFGDGVLVKYSGNAEECILPENIKCIAGFFDNKHIKSVSIPTSAYIADSAFAFCTSLKKVDIPSAKEIDNYAFEGCTSLNDISFRAVRSIGDYAFYKCKLLEKAYFYCNAPDDFGKYVFDGCADNFTILFANGTSGWTTPVWNGYTAKEFTPEYITGDLNSDSKVNTADAVIVLKYSAEMIMLDEKQKQSGDCNFDGKVNTADAVIILKYAAGMITGF